MGRGDGSSTPTSCATARWSGPTSAAIEQLARSCGLRITAAGGVSTREDLVRLRTLAPLGVDEVIVGKALYEERFTVAEANAALAGQDDAADR